MGTGYCWGTSASGPGLLSTVLPAWPRPRCRADRQDGGGEGNGREAPGVTQTPSTAHPLLLTTEAASSLHPASSGSATARIRTRASE